MWCVEVEMLREGVPRHADTMEYRYSTGFEALLGYLYLSGQRGGRLKELLEKNQSLA